MFIKGLCVKYSLEIKFLITFAVYLFLSPLVVFIGYLFVLSSHGLVIGVFNQYDFFLLDEYQFLYYLYSVVTILASVVVYVVLLNSLVKYKAGAKELIEFKTKTIEWFRDVTKHGNQ
jgi:hypothetical protein